MESTTKSGNDFRDAVANLLRSAGFYAEIEVQLQFKNADVVAAWSRDEIAGKQYFAVEAKAYSKAVPLKECTQFVSDYSQQVEKGYINQAWLISKGPISPEGRKAIQGKPGFQVMTFAELQRRLLRLDPYLDDIIQSHASSRLAEYYIRPETPEGQDLETRIRQWIAAENAAPLFVLGPYGKGKSTFAAHLAAAMAREALDDPTARAPILIKLGEIADEQSLDGLLGKVLASQHRVQGYHFETFRALNRHGRFLILYDGFDEMKHGLTPTKFQQVLSELMKLDEGDARILVLGRDTAFHDEAEFRAVIDGMQVTGAGRLVPAPGRQPYRHVEIRGFTADEARLFVERFLPIRAAEERTGAATDPTWVKRRVEEVTSGQFDNLLERPVHAQMLCEIAVHQNQLRTDMSVYELFDTFVHYLLNREVNKRGRDSDFPIDARRRFNASLAWWLWERGGASTTTLNDIPQPLCDEAVRGVQHELTREEMRRELIQGCLIEKGANTIYFHRSLQEFLVGEHLIETELLQRSAPAGGWLQAVTAAVTPEVIEFIIGGVQVTAARRERVLEWLGALARAQAYRIPFAGFELFTRLAEHLVVDLTPMPHAPWLVWLTFLRRTGARNFAQRGRNTYNVLIDLLRGARAEAQEVQAAVLYAVARTFLHEASQHSSAVASVLAAQIDLPHLRNAVAQAQAKPSERHIVRDDDDFLLWALLRSWTVAKDDQDRQVVTVDLYKLLRDLAGFVQDGFEMDQESVQIEITVPVQAIYQALGAQSPGIGEGDIDGIRPFFNNPGLRKLLSPIQIEHRPAVVPTPQPQSAARVKKRLLAPR